MSRAATRNQLNYEIRPSQLVPDGRREPCQGAVRLTGFGVLQAA